VLGDTHRLLVLTTNNLCLFLMPETSSNWHLPRRNFYATVHRGISIAAAENVLHKNIQIPASSAFWLTRRVGCRKFWPREYSAINWRVGNEEEAATDAGWKEA